MNKAKVLVTGATGFIGRKVVERLLGNSKMQIRAVPGREGAYSLNNNKRLEIVSRREINGQTSWDDAVNNVNIILHLAARAHIMHESGAESLTELQKVNVDGSANLAKHAAEAGVNRFIFISSIGVNGNYSTRPFTANDPPNPVEPYAVSKLEAEKGLRQIADETGMELVVIRPPLVYGPNAPGNFGRLVRLMQKGLPLPLSLVQNRRSLVALDNLVDLILTCIDHPAAAGQTFLVSDGEDLSTPELIRKLARAMGKKARLLPVPPVFLRLGGKMLGKESEMDRLLNSLQVDIRHTCGTLGWQPPISVDEGLKETAKWYMHGNQ